MPSVLSNHIRVYRRSDGGAVGLIRHTLAPNTTLDGTVEFGVFRRRCGEYLLTGEDFLQNKCLVCRWMPEGPNFDFERPVVADGDEVKNPADAAWVFDDDAGIVRAGSKLAGHWGVASGKQAGYVRDGGSFYQALPTRTGGNGLKFRLAGDDRQRVEVLIDNRLAGLFQPHGDYRDYQTEPLLTDTAGHVVKFKATGSGIALIDEVQMVSVAVPPPPRINDFSVVPAPPDRAMLYWNPAPGATSYTIYRTEAAIQRFEPVITNLKTTAWVDTAVQPDRTYEYRVVPVSSGGESQVLHTHRLTIPSIKSGPTPANEPPQSVCASGGHRAVHLWWRPVDKADAYVVLRSSSLDGPLTTVAARVTERSCIDTDVRPGERYFYRVAVAHGNEHGPLSFSTDAEPLVISNLGFEYPVLEPKTQVARPPHAGWKFSGEAGLIALDHPSVAAHKVMEGRQAAWLTPGGGFYQDLDFEEGDHLITFRGTQLHGHAKFRVTLDDQQIGVFEPPHSPATMMTRRFTTIAGPHRLSFEGCQDDPADSKEPDMCLIDAITLE